MELATLRLSAADDAGIAHLELHRPERRNAFSPRMAHELRAVLDALARDAAVRVVVLRGAGGTFCSGGDLQGDGDAAPDAGGAPASAADVMRDVYNPAVLALHAFPKPVLAAVEGVAAGAGVNLALGCDVVYAAEGARFCEIFARRSLALDCGGSWLLPRLVGLHRAKEIALFADWLDAQDAKRMGIVAEVFGADELGERVDERAARLAALPPLALAAIKRNLADSASLSFAESLEREASAQTELAATRDFGEAMRAFFEKRAPRFEGR
ncbi:MAG: enoyl-CoA hydratase-related protein [Myxococcota bacterium]|nr:enoyl-CoA hydratase/isomerase family protein [Myxococcales bacterium]